MKDEGGKGKGGLGFVCPSCGAVLEVVGDGGQRCAEDGQVYRRVDGIWRFLRPEREAFFAQFIHEYETVRQAEGRGSEDAAYYRALPFADLSGRMTADWAIRAQSFTTLLEQVIKPLSSFILHPSSFEILDLGAGNGWLSYQLAKRGYGVTAVDLTVNVFDGLGAHIHYDKPFTPIQAEFDHLPLTGEQVDLVIFNASFHYSTDYETTLGEALRVVAAMGRVVVVDTPIYHDGDSGAQMVQEREAHFQQHYGFPSNAVPSRNYLTYERLSGLAQTLSLDLQLLWPLSRWRWWARRWRARVNGRREPAQFPLILLQKQVKG